ncbi:MAG: carboxylate-amine ligase [Longimicrobiales bacterium]
MRELFTIGVEEEYQVVQPGTGELRSRAGVVLQADRSGELEGEVQDTMLEIGTEVCVDAAEVADGLRKRRFQASAAAAAEDLEILAAGMHPFSGWWGHELTDADRPRMLSTIFRQLLRQQHVWGLHIHVALPEKYDRVVVMNTVRAFGPHLLALSCSSPLHLGEDTGFASFRNVAWRGYPFTGAPPRFASTAEYNRFMDLLLRARAVPDERTVYWSSRPSARYPTLELRICDACPRLADAVAIAALARALVVAGAEDKLTPLASSLSASLQDEVLTENEWIVARDGLDATLVAPERAEDSIPIREAIEALLEVVGPIAASFGDADAIRGVEAILRTGNGSDRIRARYRKTGSLSDVVEWLVGETRVGTGIDRRTRGRHLPTR